MSRIARLGIVGGTHGNELTGAFLVEQLRKSPAEVTRAGLETVLELGNPKALELVRRYVDRDLNRSFKPRFLAEPSAEEYEQGRAAELANALRGDLDPASICLLDLHTTTAGMGPILVLAAENAFNLAMLAYVQARSDVKGYLWQEEGAAEQPGFLNSLSPNGAAIEVGPVPQGVLRADVLRWTRQTLMLCVDFVAAWNAGERFVGAPYVLHLHEAHVDFPRDDAGRPAAVVHPDLQDRDFEPLRPADPLFLSADGTTLPFEGEATRYPVFINEAAYYEKGIALTLTTRREGTVPA